MTSTDTGQRTSRPYDSQPRSVPSDEMCVIGAVVQSRQALDEVSLILSGPDDFWQPRNAIIYRAALEQRDKGGAIDPLLILASLDPTVLRNIDGGPYLHTCMAAIPTIANAAHYAHNVRKAATLRRAAAHAQRAAQIAANFAIDHADEGIALIQQSAGDLGVDGRAATARPWGDVARDVFEAIERIEQEAKQATLPGIPTGWIDFDRLTNGLQPGQMVIIAGRPAMGKTVCGLNVLQNAVMRAGKRGLFFSAEMDAVDIGMRMLAAGASIPLHVIKSGQLTTDDWVKAARYVGDTGEAELLVDDTPGVSWAHIEATMHRLEAQDKRPDIVAVDYLGLMQPPDPRKPRREQIDDLTRMGKLFGKRWGVVLLMLCQLNRGNEQRTDKRPQLSDLRESGSIEADADIVVLLHRDDYYDKESPRAGEIDLIVAKHRGGPTDTITLGAQLHYSRLVSLAVV
ncbi:replicative DNA helicase [Micromonospora sp. C51]|uniref:replicative DNA helicase n=1 Tax=Micromonospora sp. C51 TaxID=2824879 RepID=UPI001B36DCE3|nr:replicative DNA helicase [Micromonospora sp. C51]MBQ1047799.1 replicative DNA helicase [Micromonospora sp. C51]